MKEKILGLDLGLQSVGWAIIETDILKKQGEILDAGARVFPAAEDKGESPAKKRRIKRGQRRRLRRVRERMRAIRQLFGQYGLLDNSFFLEQKNESIQSQIDMVKLHRFHLEQNKAQSGDLWKLRTNGLDRKLNSAEWCAVLTQLAKRRGFKSNRKTPLAEDKESGVILKAIRENKEEYEKGRKEGRYRTIGEMLCYQYPERKRNRGSKQKDNDSPPTAINSENYKRMIGRENIKDEIITLFEKQRELGNPHACAEFEEKYLEIWERQRSVSENIHDLVGACRYEEGEKRAPKLSYTAECAKAWQDIHNNTLIFGKPDEVEELKLEEKLELFHEAERSSKLTYKKVREILKLNEKEEIWKFKNIFYRSEHEQLRKKLCNINIQSSGKSKEEKEEARHIKVTKEQQNEIYLQALKKFDLCYLDIREHIKLDQRFFIQYGQDENKPFFEFKKYKTIYDKLAETGYWSVQNFSGENLTEKLNGLVEICMFSRGEIKINLLNKSIGAEYASCLVKFNLDHEDEKKETITEMKGLKIIRKEADKEGIWNRLEIETKDVAESTNDLEKRKCLDILAEAVTYFKTDDGIRDYIKENIPLSFKNIEYELQTLASRMNMTETANLSIKALRKILPYLKEGKKYHAACEAAGYKHTQPAGNFEKHKKLPAILPKNLVSKIKEKEQEQVAGKIVLDIRNPRVLRTLSQARKIVNAVIEKHGPMDKVHVELLRDLARSPKDRSTIAKNQKKFRDDSDEICKWFRDTLNHEPTSMDILKKRLWNEQAGFCPYSDLDTNSSAYMEPENILKPGHYEIDHILPLSRSMDNSKNNKVLCFKNENQNKANKIPYEYLSERDWVVFCERVKYYKPAKKARLLKKHFNKADAKEHQDKWIESPESRWIASEFKNLLENHLQFSTTDNKRRVQTRNGTFTGFLRAQWGLHKSRDNHRHHALDAIVIAAGTESMVQKVMHWSKANEIWTENEGEKALEGKNYKKHKFPEPWLGFANQARECGKNVFISQPPKRKLSNEAHAETLEKKGKGKHLVRDHGMHGVPKSWATLRTDIFQKKAKHYLSVVKPYHLVQGVLPNEFLSKTQANQLDESYQFVCSLFNNDLIHIMKKDNKALHAKFPKGENHAGVLRRDEYVHIVGYFKGVDVSSGRIIIQAHDRSWSGKDKDKIRLGAQNLTKICKLEVPLLGDISMEDVIEQNKYVVKQGGKRCGLAKPIGDKRRYA